MTENNFFASDKNHRPVFLVFGVAAVLIVTLFSLFNFSQSRSYPISLKNAGPADINSPESAKNQSRNKQDYLGFIEGNKKTAPLNLTDALAQKILNTIGGSNPQQLLDQLPQEAIKKIDSKDILTIVRSVIAQNSPLKNIVVNDSEIKLSKADDKNAGLTYVSDMVGIVSQNLGGFSLNRDPVAAVKEAVEKSDYYSLNASAVAYEAAAQSLKNISVPKSWKVIHKNLLKYFETTSQILKAVSRADTDPLGAMIAINILDDLLDLQNKTAGQVQWLLNKQGIVIPK